MFFTKSALVLASLLLVLAVLRIATGLLVGFGVISGDPDSLRTLLGGATSGQAINQGSLALAAAIALGTLGEISSTIHDRADSQENS